MIGNCEEIIKWLFAQDREKLFEIKEHKEKKSLRANGYAWHLIGLIADNLRTSKDEVYLTMLERYGQSLLMTVSSEVDMSKCFKYYKVIEPVWINCKLCVTYKVMIGVSEYDTRDMSIFIDGVVSEAKDLGLEVLPEDEIIRLKEMWKGK